MQMFATFCLLKKLYNPLIPGRLIVPEWTWPGRGTFLSIPGLSRAIRDIWSPYLGHPPKKSTSLISDPPPFLVGLVHKTQTKAPCTNSLSIVRRGFCLGAFVRGSFVWKVLSGVVLLE